MEKANDLQKEFEGLNEKQQVLLAYRKIIKLRDDKNSVKDILDTKENSKEESINDMDAVHEIIKASNYNCRYLSSLLLYSMYDWNSEYKDLYKDSLVSYNKILENYKMLARELNINSALDLSYLFTYMLWNGYYSVNKMHSYKLQERLIIPGMSSFDVIKGKGVCLAYAELLYNYLTSCDKKTSLLNCKVPTRKNAISCNYRPEIQRNIENNIVVEKLNKILMPLLKVLTNKIGNHAMTLIEDNGKIFAYDPTNLYVLNIIDQNTASVINGEGCFEIKPLATLMINPNTDPNQLLEKVVSNSIDKAYTRKEIIFSFENIMELIKKNINLLDDAYNNIHSELEIIDKQTDEIGGHFKVLKKLK